MALRRYGTFTGGIDLPDEKHDTLARPVLRCDVPERLGVPLAPCGGAAAAVEVEVGARVEAGQRLAAAPDETAVDIFAPLAGTVAALATVSVAARGGFVESPAIELAELSEPCAGGAPAGSRAFPPRADGAGDAGAPRAEEAAFDWAAASEDELTGRIAAGGLTTCRPAVAPLSRWLARAREHNCRTLIANVLEQEPYVTADHRVLAERGAEVVEGLAILARAIGSTHIVLAADRRRTAYYEGSMGAAERLGVALIALPHKYPMGADAILAKVLTRRETPPGRDPMAVGAAIVDAATCLAARRWVVCGTPPLGRVVTVAGPLAAEPRNVWAPFGASCAALAGERDGLLIHGGPMTGTPCDGQAVVTAATQAVLTLDATRAPTPSPCIRCGWCTDHCPVRLNVAALNDAFELSLVARAEQAGAPACVGCGVCSYVCPARLPLTQRVRQLKRRILSLRSAPAATRGGPHA